MTKKRELPAGVYPTRGGKFTAKYSASRRTAKHLGTFDTAPEAEQAYNTYIESISSANQNCVIARLYDAYETFRKRDDGETDYTPIYHHR